MDQAEHCHQPLSLIFLDWSKAFDRVTPKALLTSLERYQVPPLYRTLLENMFNDATFYVNTDGNNSSFKSQQAGIRQGCPLSPYLFIITMSALSADVNDSLPHTPQTPNIQGHSKEYLLYADDTVIFSNDTRRLNQILASIENIGKLYGLQLNKLKMYGPTIPQPRKPTLYGRHPSPLHNVS